VWFFEGKKEYQEARLKQLRVDPEYQKPCKDGEFPARFEGGATCEACIYDWRKWNKMKN
jgi:hypothetical protein